MVKGHHLDYLTLIKMGKGGELRVLADQVPVTSKEAEVHHCSPDDLPGLSDSPGGGAGKSCLPVCAYISPTQGCPFNWQVRATYVIATPCG